MYGYFINRKQGSDSYLVRTIAVAVCALNIYTQTRRFHRIVKTKNKHPAPPQKTNSKDEKIEKGCQHFSFAKQDHLKSEAMLLYYSNKRKNICKKTKRSKKEVTLKYKATTPMDINAIFYENSP